MLRLWPIRTKLWITVSLLSLVLVMLSLSGLWGLYRYKNLASEVGRQASELPQAAELNRLAMNISASYQRRQSLINDQGLIDSCLNFDDQEIDPVLSINLTESTTFRETVSDIEIPLTMLTRAVENRDQDSLLVDDKQQLELIQRINKSVNSIKETNYFESSTLASDRAASRVLLHGLTSDTEQLLAISHSGMAEFSERVKAEYRTLIGIAWAASIIAAAVIVTLVLAFRSYVVKPFRTLLTGSRLVVDGHLDHVIQLGGGDELSELAGAINGMTKMFRSQKAKFKAEVRQRTQELIRNEQLASVGFLAAGVAHEINNPLAAIAWNAESLQGRLADRQMLADYKKPGDHKIPGDSTTPVDSEMFGGDGVSDDPELDAEIYEALRLIEEDAYRCKEITERMLDLSRMGEPERDRHDLRGIVSDLVSMVTKLGKYKCKSVEIIGAEQLPAFCNFQEIRQVILNLITNALESVDTDGRVKVRLSHQGNWSTVEVIDNGCGMSQEVLTHLFEPFFTRRRDGSGTGLGLSVTYRIVSEHGGSLQATSDGEGHGSTMTLMIPTAATDQHVEPARIDSPEHFHPIAIQRAA